MDTINTAGDIVQSDFIERKAHYRTCDYCYKEMHLCGTSPLDPVDYDAKQKSEAGRFMFINIGLCKRHWGALPDARP